MASLLIEYYTCQPKKNWYPVFFFGFYLLSCVFTSESVKCMDLSKIYNNIFIIYTKIININLLFLLKIEILSTSNIQIPSFKYRNLAILFYFMITRYYKLNIHLPVELLQKNLSVAFNSGIVTINN